MDIVRRWFPAAACVAILAGIAAWAVAQSPLPADTPQVEQGHTACRLMLVAAYNGETELAAVVFGAFVSPDATGRFDVPHWPQAIVCSTLPPPPKGAP